MDEELRWTLERIEQRLAELAKAVDPLRQTVGAPVDPMIPLKVAAGRSGFSCECVRLWVVQKIVRGCKRGGRWFVDWEDLNAHLRR